MTKNGRKVFSTTSYDDMRKFLTKENRTFICHNLVRFDKPNLERLLDIKITGRIVDSLGLSWTMFPKRARHGLEDWGRDVGVDKPPVEDWENLPIEEYINRCEEDAKINYLMWVRIFTVLKHLYNNDLEEIWRYVDYITSKLEQARLQERSRWKLDIEFTEQALIKLTEEQKEKINALERVMPKVPIIKKRTKPKRWKNKNGQLTKLAEDWVNQLKELNLPSNILEFEFVSDYKEPNPGSTDQIKEWLYSLGWKPETFKQVKNKETGEIREVPQINKERQKGGGVCDSVKKLYEVKPELEHLDGLSILNHRISILNGFLRDQKNGYLQAKISGFTNTLRVKHTEIVNLPKINIAYGEYLRGALIAPEGYELCGADKSGLENRLKEHYIFPLDPEYVKEMSKPDFDPHLDIALQAKRLTEEEVQAYKDGDHTNKIVRDVMKNVNYAAQYGAGPPRISITGGIPLTEARALHKVYWERNWAIKEVASQQIVKEVNGLMWIYNPVSKFWYWLKYEKDRFSTLVQGTASYCFDIWINFILERRPQLTATFHDEGVWTVKKGFRKEMETILKDAIDKTNQLLNLNRVLAIDIQWGNRYSEIH